MAKNISPFAALTSEQKQMKWMEYQSIRLPYTEADLTPAEGSIAEEPPKTAASQPCTVHEASTQAAPKQPQMPRTAPMPNAPERPMPPPEVYMQQRTGTFSSQEKTRHHQYDAVIARMKQAELRTGSYCSWSK